MLFRSRVAVHLHGRHDLLRRDAKLVRAVVDDALVRLMRDEPVDVGGGVAGGAEGVLDHVGDHRNRMLEHRAPFHPQMPDRLRRGRTAVDIQFRFVTPVGTQMSGQDAAILARAGLLLRFHHDGTRAVAEQHAGGAVVPVENARERLGPDDQSTLVGSSAEKSVGDRQRVDKARAYGLQIERGTARDPKPRLDRKSTRLNSSHMSESRMPSSA